MSIEVKVQRLGEAAWEDLGSVAVAAQEDAVEQLSRGSGIYRCTEVESDLWRFIYVDEDGRVVDSGAASRL
jgi:hypothetical protein